MKLSKYLADYVNQELKDGYRPNGEFLTDAHVLEQGIEAFESTEGVKIRIVDIEQQDIKILIDLAKEFVEWASSKSFCNSGQHICDRLASYFEEML